MAFLKRNRAGDQPGFPGAVALVTGAGNGIGRATAARLAAAGATVIATDVDGDAAARTAADVGGKSHPLDVRDRQAWADLAASVNDEHGALDILVNNAGVGLSARMLDITHEDWDWVLDIDLRGVINGCLSFGPAMVAAGRGHIANVSSGLGYVPRAAQIGYCTAKAGVIEFTRSLRSDWRPRGLTVSVICPAVINSGINQRVRFKGAQAGADVVKSVDAVFSKGLPPERVADAIVDAFHRDRAVVPVGWGATLPWHLRSFMPPRLVDLIGGAGA
jgi:NAD(P)-dependent dehydrogenase (short-subunit alcohol dehydrogenase family)